MSPFVTLAISLASVVFGYDEADIVFAGDAMQHQAQLDAAHASKTSYDYSTCFSEITPMIASADFAVVNLETPIGKPPYSGYPCFNAPPEYATAIADAGFDLMLTANNHTLDRRASGLRSTIEILDRLGVMHIGTYANDSVRKVSTPKIANINGFRVGFLNYTYGTNGFTPSEGVSIDYINREQIQKDVTKARLEKHAELVVVCIHWGDEYKLLPNKSQRETADFLESLGVDMIIGAHPHVIQPMEFRPNKYFPEKNLFLVYSLGNFISNMKTADTRGGALAHIKLFRGADGKAKIIKPSYSLVFTMPPDKDSKNFRVVETKKCVGTQWKSRCDNFEKRAREVFDAHNINVPFYE